MPCYTSTTLQYNELKILFKEITTDAVFLFLEKKTPVNLSSRPPKNL